jgi:hypothetical protein
MILIVEKRRGIRRGWKDGLDGKPHSLKSLFSNFTFQLNLLAGAPSLMRWMRNTVVV